MRRHWFQRRYTADDPPLLIPPTPTWTMFPGRIGELVRIAAKHNEGHPASIGMQYLFGLGSYLSCHPDRPAGQLPPHVMVGDTYHGLNEFGLLVGDSGGGGKGDSHKTALAVFRHFDPDWTKYSHRTGISTGEGLTFHLRDDGGVTDKRLLVFEPEFGKVLKVFERDGNTLPPTLCEAWEGWAVLGNLVRNSPYQATDPFISLLTHTTGETLQRYICDEAIAEGLLNRFWIIVTARVREIGRPTPLPQAYVDTHVKHLQRVTENALEITRIDFSAKATRHWTAHWYPALRAQERHPNPVLRHLFGRGPAHVTRLAAICCLDDCQREIKVRHVETALAWWEYATASMQLFDQCTTNPEANRIIAVMRPGTLTTTEANREIFSNHAKDVRQAFKDVVAARSTDFAVQQRTSTGGRRPLALTRHALTTVTVDGRISIDAFFASFAGPIRGRGRGGEPPTEGTESAKEANKAKKGVIKENAEGDSRPLIGAAKKAKKARQGRAAAERTVHTASRWFRDCQEYRTPQERARARRDRDQAADAAHHRSLSTRRAASQLASAVNAQSAPTSPTRRATLERAERPLWTRRPPPELDDQQAAIWDNCRHHVDPASEDYERDPHARAAWLGHLERLDAVARRRRPPSPGRP